MPLDDPLSNVGLVNVANVYSEAEQFMSSAEIDSGKPLTPWTRREITKRSLVVMDTTLRMMSGLALFDQRRVKQQRVAHNAPDLITNPEALEQA